MLDLTKPENVEKSIERIVRGDAGERVKIRIEFDHLRIQRADRPGVELCIGWGELHRLVLEDAFEAQRRKLADLRAPPDPCPCGRMTVNDCAGECGFADRVEVSS